MKNISLIYIRKTISWIREIHATRKLLSWILKNIKVNGDKIHTLSSVYYKRDDFGFPIANFLWLSGDVPRLLSYGIYVSQLGDALAFLISIQKLYKWPLNCWVRYHRENNRSYTWPFYRHVRTFPSTFHHWLIRRSRPHEGPCPNPRRCDKVPDLCPLWLLVGTSTAFCTFHCLRGWHLMFLM